MKSERIKNISRGKIISILFALLLELCAFCSGLHLIGEEDFFWHLKTGEIIFNQGPPQIDLYSFQTEEKKWIDAQWLFQLIIYLFYRLISFSGLSWLSALLSLLLFLFLYLLSWESRLYPFSFLLSLIALWTIGPRLNLRPELFSYLLTLIYFFLLEQDRKKPSRTIYLIIFFQIIWANLEGLWPIGLVIISVYFLEELFYSQARKFPKKNLVPEVDYVPKPKRLFLILLMSLLVSLVTPYHLSGFLFPFILFKQVTFSGDYLKNNIQEFFPLFFKLPVRFIEVPFLFLILVSASSFLVNLKRIRLGQLVFWAVFLFLALRARRNIPFFCLYSVFVSVNNFGNFFSLRSLDFYKTKALKIIPAILGLGLSLFLFISFISGKFGQWSYTSHQFGVGVNYEIFPVKAVDFLKSQGWKGKIFNEMGFGGYLVWRGYPDWKIYIDSRLEVYGAEKIETYIMAMKNYGIFQAELFRYRFDAVLLNPREKSGRKLIDALSWDSDWAIVYWDQGSILFLRKTPEQMPIIEKYEKRVRIKWE